MTRQDFIDNVRTWEQLIDANNCYDDCIDLSDILTHEQVDDEILSDISECDWEWRDIGRNLIDFVPGSEYYYRSGPWFDYTPVEDVDYDIFNDRREEFIDVMDRDGLWDEPDDLESWDEPNELEIATSVEIEVNSIDAINQFLLE